MPPKTRPILRGNLRPKPISRQSKRPSGSYATPPLPKDPPVLAPSPLILSRIYGSIKEASTALGVRPAQVSRWQSGKSPMPLPLIHRLLASIDWRLEQAPSLIEAAKRRIEEQAEKERVELECLRFQLKASRNEIVRQGRASHSGKHKERAITHEQQAEEVRLNTPEDIKPKRVGNPNWVKGYKRTHDNKSRINRDDVMDERAEANRLQRQAIRERRMARERHE